MHVVAGRVQDVLAILITHAGTGDRAHEGRAGDGERGRRGDHRDDVGIVDEVVGQNRAHHEHFVLEALDEQRADRTVDQARGQRFLLGRAGFALEEAAGDFTGRVVFLLVMNRQREEVLAFFLLLGERHVRHDRRFAQRGDHGSVGLTGNLARFQCQRLFAPLDGFFHFVEHVAYPYGSTPGPPGLPLSWRPHCRRPLYLFMRRGQSVTSQMDAPYRKSAFFGRGDRSNPKVKVIPAAAARLAVPSRIRIFKRFIDVPAFKEFITAEKSVVYPA